MKVTTIILSNNNSSEEIARSVGSSAESNRIALVSNTNISLPTMPNFVPNVDLVLNQYNLHPYRNMVNLFGRYWKETDLFNVIQCPSYDSPDKIRICKEVFLNNPEFNLVYSDSKLKNNSIKFYSSTIHFGFNMNFVYKKKEGVLMEVENVEQGFHHFAQQLLTYHIAEPLTYE